MFRTLAIALTAVGLIGATADIGRAELAGSGATDFSSQDKKQRGKPEKPKRAAAPKAEKQRPAPVQKVVRQREPRPAAVKQDNVNRNAAGNREGRNRDGRNRNFGNRNAGDNNTVTNQNLGGNDAGRRDGRNRDGRNRDGRNRDFGNRNFGGNPNVERGTMINVDPRGNRFNRNANDRGPRGFATGRFQAGPGRVGAVAFTRPAGFQSVRLGNNRVAPAWRSGPRRIWAGSRWRTFVPLTALGVVALGGAYYYPDAYISVARPYCTGISPEGCRLNWQRVEFEDGEGEWQCVQFCRRSGPPPARTVAFAAPPPMPQSGACEISIFSQPGFGGINATATDEQPRLDEIGWQDQIASVKVASGTWDFFSDQEFTGETMRLQPGDYPDLGAEWTKKAGSFMCVQP